MLRFSLMATTALAMATGVAAAQTPSVGPAAPQSPGMTEPIMTVAPPASLNARPSGPVAATGSESSTATTPALGTQGGSTDGGNAAETTVPGQPPKLVSTPE
jgi:hypothetical protein